LRHLVCSCGGGFFGGRHSFFRRPTGPSNVRRFRRRPRRRAFLPLQQQ
jgi:hypothetical protein